MLRRLPRVMFNVLAALSLVLCVGSVAAGVAGCRGDVEAHLWPSRHHTIQLFSLPGGVIGVASSEGWPDPSWEKDPHWWIEPGVTAERRWLVAEYSYGRHVARHPDGTAVPVTMTEWRTAVPYAVLLTGLLPAAWLIAYAVRRLRRRWAGRGYEVLPMPIGGAGGDDVTEREAADPRTTSPPPLAADP